MQFPPESVLTAAPWALCLVAAGAGGVAYALYRLLRSILVNRLSYHLPFTVSRKEKKPLDADYTDIFPHSQRETVAEILPSSTLAEQKTKLPSESKLLSLASDYNTADSSLMIFSGFTVGEVRGLGDFPDYAKLSGVPLPSPLKNFNIDTVLPRPYRPFRWNYHQTMAYWKMDTDYWLELENSYRDRVRQRQDLFAKNGKEVLEALPGSELACKELMEMVIQFLCARYPTEFRLDGNTLYNSILGTQANLAIEQPLHILMNHVPEDFALVLRDEKTGRYVFRAGVICSSLGWTLGTKIGQDMSSIHGPVPDFKDKLAFSLDRFFTKMRAPHPIQRGSWGLEAGQPLFLPEDHPEFSYRHSQDPSLTDNDVHLRVDWQTLRRLPLSGAVVFNYKALFTPISEFRDEPYIPSLILKVLNEGNQEIMKYKGTWHVEHIVKPKLKEYEAWQVEQGLIEEDWKHQTLEEAPFFPGWEKKWMRKMEAQ
ncbi:hypothetical protein HJFPF1_02452 [Paramyrothecium foliicola]|nr:hypothetical protein HJFPF1_02452 [Paramyrothecium foliicola]